MDEKMKAHYKFPRRLIEGVIKARPNRFVMMVEVGGKEGEIVRCHCPSTGRIGSIRFENIPCLLSEADGSGKGSKADSGASATVRKTKYTVEAISLDAIGKKSKSWIGINQVNANRYVEFFLRRGMLSKMMPVAKDGSNVRREVPLGKSRIDFAVERKDGSRDYLEVKTMLMNIPCEGHPNYIEKMPQFTSFERMVRHFKDVSGSIGTQEKGKEQETRTKQKIQMKRKVHAKSRALMVLCSLFDAEPFSPPEPDSQTIKIHRAAAKAERKGMEYWQLNLKVDEEGVRLLRCFPLKLF